MKQKQRLWEIDTLRGITIILMIIYHIIYNLRFFGGYDINLLSPGLFFLQKTIGSSFLLLVGISLTLSYNKSYSKVKELKNSNFIKYLKRGTTIFLAGMVITLVSWIFYRQLYIRFGILHLIGLGIILSYPLIKFKYVNLGLGIILIFIGQIIKDMVFNFSWLLGLGFMPKNFFTLDYYPLIPWIGVILIGIYLGNTLYNKNKLIVKIPNLSNLRIIKGLSFLGKHSLLIYLLHQPILIALMYILGLII
jgi:uncharacterized membrane protein